jgi:hypothetical protein
MEVRMENTPSGGSNNDPVRFVTSHARAERLFALHL